MDRSEQYQIKPLPAFGVRLASIAMAAIREINDTSEIPKSRKIELLSNLQKDIEKYKRNLL